MLGLQITSDDTVDVPIPGEPYSFGALKRAQAIGDWQSLQSHGRRALRVHIKRGAKLGAVALALKAVLGSASPAKETTHAKPNKGKGKT